MKVRLVALNAHYMHTNLALRQMLAALPEHEGAELFEAHINLPFRELLECVAEGAPDAIGFSTYIWNAPLIWRLCRALKLALPGAFLFAGGPEVCEARETMEAHPELDGVLSGEGEAALAQLIAALSGGLLADVPGLCRRSGGAIVENPPPQPLQTEVWPDAWAGGLAGLEGRILYTETSRGCPYRCAYCLSGGSGGVRALSAREAVRRLTRMAENGARLIKLVDRTFNFDRARAAEIWRGLIEHSEKSGLKPTYHFEIGAHLLDEAAFEVLARAPEGLFQFEAGIQSSDDGVLRAVGRAVPFEALRLKLMRLKALGRAHLHVDLIAGLPGETTQTFARSFDDAFGVGADMLQLGFLKLLPGSALRRDAEALGIRYEPDPPYEVLSTPGLGFFELCFLKDVERALDWYHNSGRYVHALRWLLTARAPFELFAQIARSLRARGAFDRAQGEQARATLLLELYDAPELRELMTHDLLLAGRRRDLPAALCYEEDGPLRALLRERFRPVRGQSARRYAFDVETFAMGGALERRETVVVYTP
ncbi:DUF4080 domain-containing protein [Bacillota bacterium Meth-B3]